MKMKLRVKEITCQNGQKKYVIQKRVFPFVWKDMSFPNGIYYENILRFQNYYNRYRTLLPGQWVNIKDILEWLMSGNEHNIAFDNKLLLFTFPYRNEIFAHPTLSGIKELETCKQGWEKKGEKIKSVKVIMSEPDGVDLKKLDKMLDTQLKSETKKSLNDWIEQVNID